MAKEGREKALDVALANITKKYGDGAIMRLGEATHLDVDVIPTGSLALDLALGVGGIPRGRVTEIYGPEASGKTTICQHIVAEAQAHRWHLRVHRYGTRPRPGPMPRDAAWT